MRKPHMSAAVWPNRGHLVADALPITLPVHPSRPTRERASAHPSRMPVTVLAVAWLALCVACSGDSEGNDNDATDDPIVGGEAGSPAWHGDVDAIVDQHCGGCHVEGGSAPFELSSPEAWQSFGMASLNAIDEGRMPPWMPDPDCRTYEHERLMPTEDIERLRTWIDNDLPTGDPADASPPVERPSFDATVELPMAEPYTPTLDGEDDYRCFVIEYDVTARTFVTGTSVLPGNGLVHHVLAFSLTGASAEAARAADDATPGPGYTCFGGPVPNGADEGGNLLDSAAARVTEQQQLGAWVPGQQPSNLPDGIAMQLDPGAQLVVQIHYSAVGGQAIEDDGTTLLLATTTTEPELLVSTRPVAVRDLDIPAGDDNAVNQSTLTLRGQGTTVIRGLTGHMHLLGQTLQADVVRADGQRECALSIPDWDFAWQESYSLLGDDWIVLESGDSVELTCVYDNSVENQPYVDGVQVEPRDVSWGEGTLDEMCLLYLSTVSPYVAETIGDAECPASCADACEGQDAQCMLQCAGADISCLGCVIDAYSECGGGSCTAALVRSRECFVSCGTSGVVLDGDVDACMTDTCPDEYGELLTCLDDYVSTPACASALVACTE